MIIVGLTGGIASGKSTVADMFRSYDVPIIDTDIIARELVMPGEEAYNEIINKFGENILQANGSLDRAKLRDLIFKNTDQRKQLESILHPRIRIEVFALLKQINAPYVIIVIPLLFETDYPYPLDRVLVIDTSEAIQLGRLLQRDGIDHELATRILATQLPRQQKCQLADDILTNDGDMELLRSRVDALHRQYLALSK